jgi:hypothetical protein
MTSDDLFTSRACGIRPTLREGGHNFKLLHAAGRAPCVATNAVVVVASTTRRVDWADGSVDLIDGRLGVCDAARQQDRRSGARHLEGFRAGLLDHLKNCVPKCVEPLCGRMSF